MGVAILCMLRVGLHDLNAEVRLRSLGGSPLSKHTSE